jgi:REP-associated tyrosine transposase
MPRVRRSDLPDGIYHVSARGVDGCPIFLDELDRVSFLRTLAASVARHGWLVHGFCRMGNHYHLVVEPPGARCPPASSS